MVTLDDLKALANQINDKISANGGTKRWMAQPAGENIRIRCVDIVSGMTCFDETSGVAQALFTLQLNNYLPEGGTAE